MNRFNNLKPNVGLPIKSLLFTVFLYLFLKHQKKCKPKMHRVDIEEYTKIINNIIQIIEIN